MDLEYELIVPELVIAGLAVLIVVLALSRGRRRVAHVGLALILGATPMALASVENPVTIITGRCSFNRRASWMTVRPSMPGMFRSVMSRS